MLIRDGSTAPDAQQELFERLKMRRHLGLAIALLAMLFGGFVPVLANPDRSDELVLTLRDGRELSGHVEGDRLRFRSSLDTLPVFSEKVLSLSDGALDLAGIGKINGAFVSGDFVVETPLGQIRQPAVDVVAIRGVSEPSVVDSDVDKTSSFPALSPGLPGATLDTRDDDVPLSVRAAIQLRSDGSGTSRQEISLPTHVASQVGPSIKEELLADSPAGAQITEQTDPETRATSIVIEFPLATIDELSDQAAAYHFTRERAGFFQARYCFEARLRKQPPWPLTLTVTLPGKIREASGETVGLDAVEWRHGPENRMASAPWSAESFGFSIIGLEEGSGFWNQPWLSPERATVGGTAITLLLGITAFALRHHIRMPKLRRVRLRRPDSRKPAPITKRFCTKCGAPLTQGKAFCTRCGASTSAVPPDIGTG